MNSRHGKKSKNVEGDRLSNLPDDLIHKILSFLDITQAIETSALSSRWRYMWTSMPYLNFSSKEFVKLPDFSKFVTHVLSGRNNEIEVSSVKLVFRGKISQVFVKRILDYAFSHNVQRLNITCLPGKKNEFPLSLFSSHSLKHLSFNGSYFEHCIMNPPIWNLPALATLFLYNVKLYDDTTDKCAGLFSNCGNLKKLVLYSCKLKGLNGFSICHPGLSSLTLYNIRCNSVNVVTPQLKNLTIEYWEGKLLISAPNLSSFRYKDTYAPLELSADFLQLEKVDICFSCSSDKEDAQKIVSMLQQLHSVKFLTLNSESIESLSSFVELISHLPSPFTNLKSLKIYPDYVTSEEETEPEVTMSNEVKNYLLDSSPGATFTMVSEEEIRADMNVASARKLMKDLQVVLDQLKEYSETDMDQDKAPMESHTTKVHEQVEVENHRAQPDMEVKWHFGERMTRVESCWEDLNEQLEKGYKDVGHTISMLRKIEVVLAKLPTSHMAKLEARFSDLCAEAGIIMDNIMDHLKNQCDKKPRFKCLLS